MFNRVSFDFNDTHVLVTGGANGIGHAIAKAYQKAGAQVTITGRQENVESYEHDLSDFDYLQLEVTDKQQIPGLVSQLDKLDILINNAGGHQTAHNSEWNPSGFDAALDVNLSSVFHMSDACLPLLKQSPYEGGACLLNIASSSAFFGYEPAPGYSAAKAAVIQLTKSYAVAWAKYGIRANAIAPGFVETNLTAPYRSSIEQKLRQMPIGRIGTPEDIAAATLFLTSPASAWTTGQTLSLDGGYTISKET